ncbi:MAG: DUF4340 domain-containing protein [Candidatus Omnitrophota bacterium]
MKLKHLVIFGVLLVLLAVAVVLKQRQKPAELATDEYAPLNLSFDSAKVSKIEIGKGKDLKAVEITKNEAGDWVLPTFFGARADEKKIQDLFKTIQEAKGELRAKDKALFADFELTEDKAYWVGFLDAAGKPVFTLLLGPKIPRYASVFLRKADSDQVFLAEADIFGKMGIFDDPEKISPQSDAWASLIMANPQADLVDELKIERSIEGKPTAVSHVRRETDPNDLSKKWWKYERPGVPFTPDAAKIKQFFKTFGTSPASKALDPKAKDYGFSASKWQMKLHQDNGQEILITAGAEDPATQGTFMQVSNEPVVFLLPKYYFNNLDVDDSKFFGEDPLSIDVEKIEKIYLHAPSGEVVISPKTDKRDVVVRYMNNLKGLTVSKLVFDPKAKINSNSGQLNWIEIKKEGVPETLFLDVEGTPFEGGKEHLAGKRDGTQPFLISESSFKNLFGDLQSLKPPPEPAKT